MRLVKIFKTKKIFLLNIFLTLYVSINLIGGERGLISYFEKKNMEKSLAQEEIELTQKLKEIEKKNKLLSENTYFICDLQQYGREVGEKALSRPEETGHDGYEEAGK